jgi:DNA-binding LacI/PurR family transcriptional regulator
MTPAPRRPTSADVADLAGVSRATVSMVLNDRTKGRVADTTRRRVLDAAGRLGYTRSQVAMSLRNSRTRTIGMITDEIATSPWAGRMVRAADAVAASRGYMTMSVDTSLKDRDDETAVKLLAERQVEGLLYATMGRIEVQLPPASPAGLPIVLLNCSEKEPTANAPASFIPNDLGGGRRAAQRLIDVGHRNIVMLTTDQRDAAPMERETGFLEAIRGAGIEPRIVTAGWQMADGYRATRQLFDDPAHGRPRPTALFCIRDRVAAGAIHAATVLGAEVPRDLSVIGFDDEDFFAEQLTPPLTTVALPHMEMGERAMTTLLDQLEGPAAGEGTVVAAPLPQGTAAREEPPADGDAGSVVRIACELVERESVAAPHELP